MTCCTGHLPHQEMQSIFLRPIAKRSRSAADRLTTKTGGKHAENPILIQGHSTESRWKRCPLLQPFDISDTHAREFCWRDETSLDQCQGLAVEQVARGPPFGRCAKRKPKGIPTFIKLPANTKPVQPEKFMVTEWLLHKCPHGSSNI